jgi:Tfp pilus assembly protein PilF
MVSTFWKTPEVSIMRLSALVSMVAITTCLLQPVAIAASNVGAVQAASYTSNADGENALETGDYSRAQQVFSSALANGKSDAITEGYLRLGLGEALMWQGSMNEADKSFKKASSLLKNADVKLKARLLDDLAYLYQIQGKMDNALDALGDALTIRQANAATEPAIYVATAVHMVNLLDRAGQLDKALKIATQALQVQQEKYGPDSLMASNLNDQLGLIYRKMGKSDLAQQCFKAALQVKLSRNAPAAPYAPHPYWDSVTFRFLQGSPNCLQKRVDGDQLEIVTANGVTVGAAIETKPPAFVKNASQLNIRVRNDTDQPIQFLGQAPVLVVLAPKIAITHLVDPTKLADKVEKAGDKKAKWIRFWGQDATQSMTSTMIGNGGGYWGGYQPMYGAGGAMPFYNRSGNMTTMITQVPDYAAQARALQKAADVTETSQQTAENIRSTSLGPTTIAPGQTIQGSLYFDASQLKKGYLQLPVGNAVFEFEFPPR